MSQFESFMAPFHQSLIRPVRPNRGNASEAQMPQMGWIGDHSDPNNDSMRLQMAQNMAVAQRQQGMGQSATSSNYMTGGPSPIQRAITSAKGAMLHGINADDEERKQLEGLRDNPNLSLQDFQRVLMHRQDRPAAAGKPAAAMHNFDGTAAPARGAGDISVAGPKGTMFASAPAQAQGADPVVSMIGAFKGHVSDDVLMAAQHAVNAGVPVQQVYSHLQSAVQQGAAGDARQAQAQSRQHLAGLSHQQSQIHSDLRQMAHQMSSYGVDPEGSEADAAQAGPEAAGMYHQYHAKLQQMTALQSQLDQGLGGDSPQQQPQTAAGSQQKYQVGSTIDTPKGKVKVVGLDHDGHPLVQPLG